jgi:UDP-N-acetylglucosamine transferase subunit ALG13
MKTATPPELDQFADKLIDLIDRTFHNAYLKRMAGVTETELLIDHDIEAAYHDVDVSVRHAARKTILSACRAVDSAIPFHHAHEFLIDQLHAEIDRLVKKEARKHAVAKD